MKSNLEATEYCKINVPNKKRISNITASKGFYLSLFRYPEDASHSKDEDTQTNNENNKKPNTRRNR